MIDIKEYLKQTKTVLLTQDAFDELKQRASAQSDRPKGKWIVSHVPESMLWECNQCGFDCGAHSFNFCPNCGADMRKDGD